MSQGGCLALWNSVADARWVPEYEAWHAFEHVPERVGSPHFVSARRDAAGPGQPDSPAYFTLYGLRRLAALQTPQYQALLDRPTAWSLRMRPLLRDFQREPCRLLGAWGVSRAACLATLQLRLTDPLALGPLAQCLARLVRQGHAVHAFLGQHDARSRHPLETQPGEDRSGQVLVVLEHSRPDNLQAGLVCLIAQLPPQAVWRQAPAWYQLQSSVSRRDLPPTPRARQAPRPDLQARFASGDIT